MTASIGAPQSNKKGRAENTAASQNANPSNNFSRNSPDLPRGFKRLLPRQATDYRDRLNRQIAGEKTADSIRLALDYAGNAEGSFIDIVGANSTVTLFIQGWRPISDIPAEVLWLAMRDALHPLPEDDRKQLENRCDGLLDELDRPRNWANPVPADAPVFSGRDRRFDD